MAKSKETFNKREKEKQRLKQKAEKREKMEQRKADGNKPKSLEDMMAYIDENGNLSSSPPDPRKMKSVSVEDIPLGVAKREETEPEVHQGKVSFFDTSKGFGFILHAATGERIFVHASELIDQISEEDKVSFEMARGPRGWNAVGVKKI